MTDTQYRDLSREQLNDLFHSENWDHLSADERLAACQEMHNRYADEHQMERSQVVVQDMQGTNFGAYNPQSRCIELNRSVMETGQIVTADGERIAYSGSNAETLDTLFHESSHAYDHQLGEAVELQQAGEEYNNGIVTDAESRGIDVDLARASDTIYISPSQNPDLYRVQDCEKRAYETGENETAKVFEDSSSRLGEDSGYRDYRERLELNDSYDSSLDNLKEAYRDDNIDQTLNEQTKNLYFNDSNTEDASGTNASRSAISSELRQTYGGLECARNNAYGYEAEHYQGNSNLNVHAKESAESADSGSIHSSGSSSSDSVSEDSDAASL